MTLDEHQAKLKGVLVELARTQVGDALLTSLDMIAFVKLRLAEGGGNSQGGQFTDYSPIYSKRRQEKGLQVAHKDFNVTGQLYASIQPQVKAASLGVVEVDIIPRGADNQMKVIGQLKRDGNILQPSQQEIDDATQAHQQRRFERASRLFE